jgi:prepilin-type processing-associated H-X9-DG protein
MFDFEIYTDEQLKPSGEPIGSTHVATLVCPSEEPREATELRRGQKTTLSADQLRGYKMTNYQASRGPTRQNTSGPVSCALADAWNTQFGLKPVNVGPPPCKPTVSPPGGDGITWLYPDIGNSECWTRFGGPFSRWSHRVKLKQVSDGTSHTIFMGEVRTGCSEHAAEGWAWSHSGNGLISTLIPINFDSCTQSDDGALDCASWATWSSALGFKSPHPGGAQFVMGDGSVHFLPEAIDMTTYNRLGGKADGEAVAIP